MFSKYLQHGDSNLKKNSAHSFGNVCGGYHGYWVAFVSFLLLHVSLLCNELFKSLSLVSTSCFISWIPIWWLFWQEAENTKASRTPEHCHCNLVGIFHLELTSVEWKFYSALFAHLTGPIMFFQFDAVSMLIQDLFPVSFKRCLSVSHKTCEKEI